MKLGIGLDRHQLHRSNYDFAVQCGATHVVVHLVDYFNQGADNPRDTQPTGGAQGWGVAGNSGQLWTVDELTALKQQTNEAGLQLHAIENPEIVAWHACVPRR